MVCHRIALDENEDISFYECIIENANESLIINNENSENNNNDNENYDLGTEEEYINRREAELNLHRRLEMEALDGTTHLVSLFTQQKRMRRLNTLRLMYAQRRWETLYDSLEHNRLRQAIICQLERNKEFYSNIDENE